MNEPKVSDGDDKVLIANLVPLFFCKCLRLWVQLLFTNGHMPHPSPMPLQMQSYPADRVNNAENRKENGFAFEIVP